MELVAGMVRVAAHPQAVGCDGQGEAPDSALVPGVPAVGDAVDGDSAAIPSRGTAPGPLTSPRYGLLTQRMCPPMYTAFPLTLTLHVVSPPVQSVHVGA